MSRARIALAISAVILVASALEGSAGATDAGCCTVAVDDYLPLWSPNGEGLAYTHFVGGRVFAQLVSRGGGPARDAVEGAHPSWSPDGRQLAVATSDGIRVVDLSDGRTRLLTNNRLDSDPAWSTDGQTIAFRRWPGDVWAVRADGGVPRLVARALASSGLTASAQRLSWSPDSTRIAFVARRTVQPQSDDELHVVKTDGSEDQVLASSPRHDRDPVWSPDGSRLAFSSERNGNADVYLIRADGTELRNVTLDPAYDAEPAWSPDGRSIAFASGRLGRYEGAALYVVAADGGEARRVGRARPANHPSWSPDGATLAFMGRSECPGLGIYVVPLGDGNAVRLTNDCTITGTDGGDRLVGTMGRDVVFALGGDDAVVAGQGPDIVFGAEGNDALRGGTEPDRLDGGPGADVLHGEGSRDTLIGGPGPDRVVGGIGRDTISARDRVRDVIDCGPQLDIVLADRKDRIGRNCERVFRR